MSSKASAPPSEENKEIWRRSLIDIDDELKRGYYKWIDSVPVVDGNFYGIPYGASHVVKYNPTDKSMNRIVPDFGDSGDKWYKGVMTDSGIIYCNPPI